MTTFESMDRREEFEYDIHGINKTSKLFSRNGHLIKDKTECRLVSSLEKEEIKEIDYSLKQVYYNENKGPVI